jgi:hypothetical protein
MRREEETPDCMREMRKDMGKRISGWDEESPEFVDWIGQSSSRHLDICFLSVFCFPWKRSVYKEE